MLEVFNFQENKCYNLRKGIHLASRNMHTAHFSTDTMSSSGPNLSKLISDKIKHASILSVFKTKDKSWTISSCSCKLYKILVEYLGFTEVCPRLMESTLMHIAFFLKKEIEF